MDSSKVLKGLLAIIIVLYISFLYLDIFYIHNTINSDILKFVSILLCLLMTIISRKRPLDNKDILLLQMGMSVTVLADIFLLILDSHYKLGVSLFSIVQIIYGIRYRGQKKDQSIRLYIYIFLMLNCLYFAIRIFTDKAEYLLFISLFYGICLVYSVYSGIVAYGDKRYPKINRTMILLGMILFLLCDINVAIYNILGYIHSSDGIWNLLYKISSISMWLYYLPSQVLLSLSGYDFRDKIDNVIKIYKGK
ncbi:lysoplasmalogenase family protein [Tissierellaceae bacterium HCP3S3_D8]